MKGRATHPAWVRSSIPPRSPHTCRLRPSKSHHGARASARGEKSPWGPHALPGRSRENFPQRLARRWAGQGKAVLMSEQALLIRVCCRQVMRHATGASLDGFLSSQDEVTTMANGCWLKRMASATETTLPSGIRSASAEIGSQGRQASCTRDILLHTLPEQPGGLFLFCKRSILRLPA